VPTNHERLVWGQGDGRGLRAIETPLGRIGGLICWENYMPLARFALYESGVEIYIASTADDGDAWQATLVHIARESRAFVVAPCHFQRAGSYPDDFPLRELLDGVDLLGAAAARSSADGSYLAGPLYDERACSTPTSSRPPVRGAAAVRSRRPLPPAGAARVRAQDVARARRRARRRRVA
jgi:nitrilase